MMLQRHAIFLLLLMGLSPTALAVNCSVNFADLSYGQVSASAGSTQDAQSTVSVTCSWGFFERLAVGNIRTCVHIGPGNVSYNANPSGFRKLINGASRMRHDLFTDGARTQVWGTRFDNLRGAQPVEVIVSAQGVSIFGGSSTASRSIFGRSYSDSGLPSGLYQDNYSGQLTYEPDGSLNNCNNTRGTLAPGSFTVDALLQAECSISASTLDFGTASSTTSALQSTSTIRLVCTDNADWQVGLSAGNAAGATISSRRMQRQGGSESIAYQLYRDNSRSLIWGNSLNIDTVSGTGTGAEQSLTVYGQVPGQVTPTVGTYKDTVVATITF